MSFDASQSAFAAALTDANAPPPPGLTTFRGDVDPARFAIYRNNVAVGLIKVLEGRFPVVRRLVGDDFFRAMARSYMIDNKPHTPLVMHYGDDFPDFIGSYEPADSVPYLADVARLEAAWTRAYNAADASPMTTADIAKLPPERLLQSQLQPHPAAALISSRFPIGSIWAAHQEAAVEPVRDWRPQTVLIARPELDVVVHILPETDASFALSLSGDMTIGSAAQNALEESSTFDFGTALTGLISLGAFGAVRINEVSDDHDD